MGERVNARRGGDGTRQRVGECGVDDRQSRQHAWGSETHLDPVLRGSEDGVLRDFGSGARGGGNGDKGQGRLLKRASFADDLEIVEWVSGVGREGGDCLAGIDGA